MSPLLNEIIATCREAAVSARQPAAWLRAACAAAFVLTTSAVYIGAAGGQ